MSDVAEIELSIEHAKELVAKGDMAMKLASNRDFRKLIMENYFKEEAARLVGLLAEPAMEKHRTEIQESMLGIAHFQTWLRGVVRMGNIARAEITEFEQALDDAREEAGEEA